MAKVIIPIKCIVNLNPDGTMKDGVFQYQLTVDGVNNKKFFTVGIQDAMDEETVGATNTLMQKALELAQQAEGIV